MSYTRPDPITKRPKLPVIRNKEMVTCHFCGRTTKLSNELCPSCGAPLEIPTEPEFKRILFPEETSEIEWDPPLVPKPSHNDGAAYR